MLIRFIVCELAEPLIVIVGVPVEPQAASRLVSVAKTVDKASSCGFDASRGKARGITRLPLLNDWQHSIVTRLRSLVTLAYQSSINETLVRRSRH